MQCPLTMKGISHRYCVALPTHLQIFSECKSHARSDTANGIMESVEKLPSLLVMMVHING